jgi:hypothetical protein
MVGNVVKCIWFFWKFSRQQVSAFSTAMLSAIDFERYTSMVHLVFHHNKVTNSVYFLTVYLQHCCINPLWAKIAPELHRYFRARQICLRIQDPEITLCSRLALVSAIKCVTSIIFQRNTVFCETNDDIPDHCVDLVLDQYLVLNRWEILHMVDDPQQLQDALNKIKQL